MTRKFTIAFKSMVRHNPGYTVSPPSQQTETGLDALLSKHIAHLFIRDPLVVFSETIDQDDSSSSDHFEVGDHCRSLAM
jgi:hypothetical protein